MTLRSLLLVAFAVALAAAVLPAESSAQTSDWTFCAYEGQVCTFAGTQQVRYGANGLYTYQTLSGGATCSNSVFGDPAPGLVKQCDTIGTSSWSLCAYEGGVCAFTGTQQVRYGANGLYAYQTVTGGTSCSNSVFGDPAPGFTKQCDTSTTSTSTGSWSLCAYEGGVCAFTGTQQVRYGANGLYTYQTLSGGTACSNSVFGDPALGMMKQCHTSGSSTSPATSPVTSLPGTVVFTPSSNHATAVDSYVLDVFPVGADPYSAYPVGTHYLGKPPISNGEIRADISSTIQALVPGTYIATVTAVGIGGSARSAPSPQFSR